MPATMIDPFAPTVPTPGQAVELLNAGNYVGALVGLIDLGTQESDYKGETKEQRQILLVWELDEEKADGTRHVVAVQYNNSMNEKAGLRLMIEKSQRVKLEPGQPYPLRSLLGKSFDVNIENTRNGDRTYHRVAKDGIGPLHKKDDPIPAADQREHFTYAVGQGRPDRSAFAWVPYLYGRPVPDVICECKELFGSETPAPAEQAQPAPPRLSATRRDEYIGLIEGHFAKARMAGTPDSGPDREMAFALMKQHGVRNEELGPECQGQLPPF